MDNNIIIPKRIAVKSARSGGGGDYWDEFWKTFGDSRVFSTRIQEVKSSLTPVLALNIPQNKDIYVQVTLDERADAKSNQPILLWAHSNLDVVESKDDQTITLSGTKSDFQKLDNLLSRSEFGKAKQRSDDISRTEMNLYRECFAMTALKNKNTDLETRIDHAIKGMIGTDVQGELECIIEAYSNQKRTSYNNLFEMLREEIGNENVKKRDERFFFYNMSFLASLTLSQIQSLLTDVNYNFIRMIRLAPTFVAERCIPNTDIANIRVLNPATDEIVGIIDSGVSNGVLAPLKFNQERHLSTGEIEDTNHGTFVTSRVLFGDDIFTQARSGSITPSAKYLDIQVLHQDGNGSPKIRNIDVLQKAIHEAVERYPDVKIYNLSIGQDVQVEEDQIEELTQFLDHTAREYDIVFVCSAGNQHSYIHATDYEEIFTNNSFDNKIASPADALNVITVGSISKSITSSAICATSGFPSPFTRKGGIRGGWKKPELVASGGNKTKDPFGTYDSESYDIACRNTVGVEGIDNSGLAKGIGTSFSAPLVTRQSIYLLDYIKKSNIGGLLNLNGNRANLIKSLLIQSTAKVNQVSISNPEVKKAYGFGEANYTGILKGDENEVSIVYADRITYAEKLHKVRFKLPEFTSESPVEFIFTMVYNPPVNRNFSEYSMVRLTSSLKTIRPFFNPETGKLEEKSSYVMPKERNWDNYKNEDFNVTHFRIKKRNLNYPYMEVLTQMYVSENYESEFTGREVENIFQPYTFVLTIRDTSAGNRLRSELMATNQFDLLVENQLQIET